MVRTRLQTGLGGSPWCGVDASLDGIFYLGTAVAVSRARYELVTRGEVVNSSLAQSTGGGRGSRRCLHKGKTQDKEDET